MFEKTQGIGLSVGLILLISSAVSNFIHFSQSRTCFKTLRKNYFVQLRQNISALSSRSTYILKSSRLRYSHIMF